jgi:hypothetical protein
VIARPAVCFEKGMLAWLPVVVVLGGAVGFILAGASAWSLRVDNRRAARASARASLVFASIAVALGTLWLSATLFWPVEYSDLSNDVQHPLALPIRTIAICLGLVAVELPIALVVLSILRRRGSGLR